MEGKKGGINDWQFEGEIKMIIRFDFIQTAILSFYKYLIMGNTFCNYKLIPFAQFICSK